MGREAWTQSIRLPGSKDPGEERATTVFSGEITMPRAWPRTDSPQLDDMFGPYLVQEQLGIGGMATVHRAERRVGGVRQRVALKRLLPHVAEDDELVRLFLDEARLVSLIHHRNIAEVYECGQVASEYFLAMELVAGPTLKKLLRQCASTVGLMPYPLTLNLLGQICEALAYAHELNDEAGKRLDLVHRDVSPSNIVISSNGVVKLIDFGVAKTVSTHTQAGIIKGKLGYIAPEYLEGSIDRRADLWALGVIAYELLTNKRLFDGEDEIATMQLIKTQVIDPPSRHNADVPPELDAIVMTALERDPDRRWQNAAAMRNALVGVAPASTNAEVMEWVEWVFGLDGQPLVPVRASQVTVPLLPPAVTVASRAPSFTPSFMSLLPAVGTAMLQRRKRASVLLPLLFFLLCSMSSALGVLWFYDLL